METSAFSHYVKIPGGFILHLMKLNVFFIIFTLTVSESTQNMNLLFPHFSESDVMFLRVLVQSVVKKLSNSLCPTGRIHHRTHECKWSILKLRKEKYKGGAWWGPGGMWRPRELASPALLMGREEPGDFHPIRVRNGWCREHLWFITN
jgi:hypothetical protein